MPKFFDDRSVDRIRNAVHKVEQTPMPAESTIKGNNWRGEEGSTILHIVDTWDDRPTASLSLLGHILYVKDDPGVDNDDSYISSSDTSDNNGRVYDCYEGVESDGTTLYYYWQARVSDETPAECAEEGDPCESQSAARAGHVHPLVWLEYSGS
jgi:hypothetical protein